MDGKPTAAAPSPLRSIVISHVLQLRNVSAVIGGTRIRHDAEELHVAWLQGPSPGPLSWAHVVG